MLYFGCNLYSNLIKFVIIVCMLINKGFEMDFKLQNDKDREFYKKDFSKINDLLKVIRKALAENVPVDISNIDYSEFFDDKNMKKTRNNKRAFIYFYENAFLDPI